MKEIVRILQIKSMEKFIENRFSMFHTRIIRILERHDFLDEKKVLNLFLIIKLFFSSLKYKIIVFFLLKK